MKCEPKFYAGMGTVVADKDRLKFIIEHKKGIVNTIQSCIDARLKLGVFKCSCGVCQQYLLQRAYESLTTPEERTSIDYTIITAGPHTGKTYKQVYDTDKKYCIWCIQQTALDPHSEVASFADWVTKMMEK